MLRLGSFQNEVHYILQLAYLKYIVIFHYYSLWRVIVYIIFAVLLTIYLSRYNHRKMFPGIPSIHRAVERWGLSQGSLGKGQLLPGQLTRLPRGWQGRTTMHTYIHIHRQLRVTNYPNLHVFSAEAPPLQKETAEVELTSDVDAHHPDATF